MDYEDLNNWADLANAVILEAVLDYREACMVLKYRPDRKVQMERKKSLEDFFRSGWFKILSGLDGETLLANLKKECSV